MVAAYPPVGSEIWGPKTPPKNRPCFFCLNFDSLGRWKVCSYLVLIQWDVVEFFCSWKSLWFPAKNWGCHVSKWSLILSRPKYSRVGSMCLCGYLYIIDNCFTYLAKQAKRLKLFGITYLVGKISRSNFFSGSIGWVRIIVLCYQLFAALWILWFLRPWVSPHVTFTSARNVLANVSHGTSFIQWHGSCLILVPGL